MSVDLLEVYSLQGQWNSDHNPWAVDSGIKTQLTSLKGTVLK